MRTERIPDDRRLGLWHEALALIRDNPVVGVGPGRFAAESPIAAADPDARWAHHGFLQFGAETGLPGLALLSIAFAWAIGAVGFGGKPEIVSVLGVAALVALGAGGCLDYLFHFPAIPVTAAALAGAATKRTDDDAVM
ncbi:MAG: O-antigen ligase family protein, partial [Actinomycetota bacterium]